jgi:hypothetical protein
LAGLGQAVRLEWVRDHPHIVWQRLNLKDQHVYSDAALQRLAEMADSSHTLQDFTRRLLHLSKAMTEGLRPATWWRRFTGAELMAEINHGPWIQEVKQVHEFGHLQRMRLQTLSKTLLEEQRQLLAQAREWTALAQACQEALKDPHVQAHWQHVLGKDIVQRLPKRFDHLQTLAATLELTASQCGLAVQQAQTLEERFEELQAITIPLLRQRITLLHQRRH